MKMVTTSENAKKVGKERNFLVQFTENMLVVSPSFASFAIIKCIRDVVILKPD